MKRRIYIGCLALHLVLIVGVCSRETFSLVADGHTSLPARLENPGKIAEEAIATALGETLSAGHPLRHALSIYKNAGGIETGYGFFAPAVPNSSKLVFEIRYPDGHIDYDLPTVDGATAGGRIATLLDQIARLRYEPLRDVMAKMLASSAWRNHPQAIAVRAVFGVVRVPGPAEYRRGEGATYQFTYAYDFSFSPPVPIDSP